MRKTTWHVVFSFLHIDKNTQRQHDSDLAFVMWAPVMFGMTSQMCHWPRISGAVCLHLCVHVPMWLHVRLYVCVCVCLRACYNKKRKAVKEHENLNICTLNTYEFPVEEHTTDNQYHLENSDSSLTQEIIHHLEKLHNVSQRHVCVCSFRKPFLLHVVTNQFGNSIENVILGKS